METWILIIFFGQFCCLITADQTVKCHSKTMTSAVVSPNIADVNISCFGNGSISVSWSRDSDSRTMYIQVEYQCFNTVYNKSQNIIVVDQAEAINSPALFSNVTGNNCTVIACVRMLNRLFDYRWVNSDSCLLNEPQPSISSSSHLQQSTPTVSSDSTPNPVASTASTKISLLITSSYYTSSHYTYYTFPTMSLTSSNTGSSLSNIDYTDTSIIGTIVASVIALVVSLAVGLTVIIITSACTSYKLLKRNRMSVYVDDLEINGGPFVHPVVREIAISPGNNLDLISIKTELSFPQLHRCSSISNLDHSPYALHHHQIETNQYQKQNPPTAAPNILTIDPSLPNTSTEYVISTLDHTPSDTSSDDGDSGMHSNPSSTCSSSNTNGAFTGSEGYLYYHWEDVSSKVATMVSSIDHSGSDIDATYL